MANLSNRNILMIIAFKDFRDEEYFIPKEIFQSLGANVKTASTQKGEAIGSQGNQTQVDIELEKLKLDDFDAVVFVGGQGALRYLDNETSYQIARDAVEKNKIVSAICASPAILAKAGILRGKKATVWSSPLDKSLVKILEENGALYSQESVVGDGKIVTANGPSAAKEFANYIAGLLTKE